MNALVRSLTMVVAGLVAVAALGPVASRQAEASSACRLDFGMVGIAAGQTARLNVVDIRSSPTPPPIRDQPNPPPIRVTLAFEGVGVPPNPTIDTPLYSQEVALGPGQSASLDMPASAVLADGATRGRFRAVLVPQPPPIKVVATLEVIDDETGVTTVFLPIPPPIVEGQPVPPPIRELGIVGVASSQTALLTVATDRSSPNPPPIRVRLAFVDEAGSPLLGEDGAPIATEVELGPDGVATLEVVGAAIVPDGQLRAPVRAVVEVDPPARVIPTLELFDAATGRTALLYAVASDGCGGGR
jgi:hypothetical protein